MAHLARPIAPALLAPLVVVLAAVAAHAETAAAASASDCLAKPNGPSAKGSHWYYRIDRPSGRHCWYQHAIDGMKIAPAHRRAVTEAAAPPPLPRAAAPVPASPSVSEASAAPDVNTADEAANVVPPVAAPPIAAPVNEPPAWPVVAAAQPVPPASTAPPAVPPAEAAAAPPAVAPVDRVPARSVESPPPAPEPNAAAPQPQLDAAPSKHPPARTPGVTRAEQLSHVPALLGAVSALVIIIIGSFAGRLLTNRSRRRPQANVRPRDWDSPVSDIEEESPGLVPVMPGGEAAHDMPAHSVERHASPDDFGLRRARAPRPVTSLKPRRAASSATPPSRESTRVLEANVRELLHRLQSDLRGQPAQPAAPAAAAAAPAHVPSEQELDAVLAMWRARRSG